MIRNLLNRLAAWYLGSEIAAERRRIEVDVLRLGGTVRWP